MSENRDDLKRAAEQAGLTHLCDDHLAQLARARDAVESMLSRIPRNLHMYDEPAHTFRASQEASS
jgi:hypothetical protein